jgi:hypothetical protein
MNSFPLIPKSVVWLLLSIFSAGGMAYYVAEIWSAHQPPHFNDLYASWWGAHELILRGRDPYSPAVAHEIQTVIYGAEASKSPQDPGGIGGGFAYPPYVAILLWPTIYLPFPVAQKIFVLLSVAATLLSCVLWMRLLRFDRSLLNWLTIIVFTLGSFPALQAIKLQNPSLLAASFIAITLFLLSRDQFILGGILLSISTFKPQFTIALIPWLALWVTGDWRRRRPLAWSFLITMLLLFVVSEWLVPGWIPSFLRVIRAYRYYTYGHSLLDVWFTPSWGPVIGTCLLLAALVFGWRYHSQSADSAAFFWITSLLLAATLVVIPTLAPHAQLLLLPAILYLLRARTLLSSVLARLGLTAVWVLLAWPWAAAFGLLVASVWLPGSALLKYWEIPLYSSALLPLAVLWALGCMLTAVAAPRSELPSSA